MCRRAGFLELTRRARGRGDYEQDDEKMLFGGRHMRLKQTAEIAALQRTLGELGPGYQRALLELAALKARHGDLSAECVALKKGLARERDGALHGRHSEISDQRKESMSTSETIQKHRALSTVARCDLPRPCH